MRKIINMILVSMACYAQEEMRLDEILVNASGIDESTQSQGSNLLLIRRDDFEDRGNRTIKDVLQRIPGVSFAGKELDLRGQGSNAKTHVRVMLDGVGLNGLDPYHGQTPYELIDLNDVQRIEVLPGGGAVMYGSGTKGGVINFITKAPIKDSVGLYVQEGVDEKKGRLLSNRAGMSVSKKLTDSLFTRLNFGGFYQRGMVDGDRSEGYSSAVDLYYLLNDQHRLRLKGSLYRSSIVAGYLNKKNNLPSVISLSPGTTDRYDLMLEHQADLSFMSVNTKAYYGYNDLDYKGFSPFVDYVSGADTRMKYFYGDRESGGELIGGYDLSYRGSVTGSILPKRLVNALYLINKHHFNTKFSLLTGARIQNDLYHIIRKARKSTFGDTPALDKKSTQYNYAYEFTPIFNYSTTGSVYAKYERGFITPMPMQLTNTIVINNNGGAKRRDYVFNRLKPETYHTFELGAREKRESFFAQLAVFYTMAKNMIVLSGGHGGSTIYKNLDQTRHIGTEMSFNKDWEDVRLYGSLSLIYAKITEGKNKNFFVPRVPNAKATFGVDYKMTKTMRIFSDAIFFGAQRIDYDKTQKRLSPYLLNHIGMRLEFAQVSFDLGVRNVLDIQYNAYEGKFGPTLEYIPGEGRNYYLQGRYVF